MEFNALFDRISPTLKRIARRRSGQGLLISEKDLYQEMSLYLWNKYKKSIPDGINDSYIIKGCEFHILNYIRKKRETVPLSSFEEPIGTSGIMLMEVLPDKVEPMDITMDRNLTLERIKGDDLSSQEDKVFSLLLSGYTVREIAKRLGVSHVMVVKYKKRIATKCRRREKKVTRKR